MIMFIPIWREEDANFIINGKRNDYKDHEFKKIKNGKIVDDYGEKDRPTYWGRKYKIIAKLEYRHTCCERLQRGLIGLALVIVTIGIALFKTEIRNLFKSKDIIRFGVCINRKEETKQIANVANPVLTQAQNLLNGIAAPRAVVPPTVITSATPPTVTAAAIDDKKPTVTFQTATQTVVPQPSVVKPRVVTVIQQTPAVKPQVVTVVPQPPAVNPHVMTVVPAQLPAAKPQVVVDVEPPKPQTVVTINIEEGALKELSAEEKEIKDHLEEGIMIPQAAHESLAKALMVPEAEEAGIKWYHSGDMMVVFTLDAAAPGLIFKIPRDNTDSLEPRYKNSIKAKKVIQDNSLHLLSVPNAKIFSVKLSETDEKGHSEEKQIHLIVERKLNIHSSQAMQKKLYRECKKLDETLKQLTIFCCLTGYSDAECRNNCMEENNVDKDGNQKIHLIDLQNMGVDPKNNWGPKTLAAGAAIGLFGSSMWSMRGLVHCVNNEAQAKMILEIAQKHGVLAKQVDAEFANSYQEAWEERKAEIEAFAKLEKFYAEKGIKMGNEPLPAMDFDFSEYPQHRQTLETLAKAIYERMSKQIKDSIEPAVEARRLVGIPTNEKESFPEFYQLDHESLTEKKLSGELTRKEVEEFELTTAVGIVVQKFMEKGFIFKYTRYPNGWSLQA